MDMLPLTDLFRFAHILVVAIGFGAAFLADIHAMRWLGRLVDNDLLTTLHACHSLVWKALIAMWVTGIIMVFIRTGFVSDNFTPKLFSKLFTVGVLTVNAFLIGRYAMPLIEKSRGRSLIWLSLRQKLTLASLGAVSSASWVLAMAMGVSKVLVTSGWLTFLATLPIVYFGALALAWAVMYLLHIGSVMGAVRPVQLVNPIVSYDRRTTADGRAYKT